MSEHRPSPALSLPSARPWRSRGDAVLRLAGLAALWLVLTGGRADAWVIGVPAVLLATGASLALAPPGPWRIRPAGLLRFLPFFLWESLRGGIDVTRRVLGPRLRLRPALVEFRSRLPAGAPRTLFVACVSLLPGTLSAVYEGEHLRIHRLDADADGDAELRRLEAMVESLFVPARGGTP